jgi:hypothetical protein
MKSNNFLENKYFFILFFTYFIIGNYIVSDYGISVDEEFHRYSGFYWLNYILQFTQFDELRLAVITKLNAINGHTLPNPSNYPFYGVTFDLPLAFFETIFELNESRDVFLLRHYLNFFVFFLGSIFFFLILKNRLKNQKIIYLGVLLYITSPRIFGDSFYNNKDIILLSFLTINIYYFFKTIDNLNTKNTIFLSIISAFTTSTRIVGIFIPIFFIFFLIISKEERGIKKKLRKILFFLIFFFLFLILFYPYLWANPLVNFLNLLKIFSQYPIEFEMLFNNYYINTKYLPLSYVPIWMLISTPIITLLLFFFSYLKLIQRFFKRLINIDTHNAFNDFWRGNNEKKDFFIFLSFSLILIYIILSNTLLYNGWRHLYFLHVFIIYISCLGIYRISVILKKNNFFYIIILLGIIFSVFEIIKFHPFQGSYFNKLIYTKKKNHFEVDYWGLAGKRFFEEILSKEKKKEKINIGVASYLPLERSLKMLNKEKYKRFVIVGQNYSDADFIFNNNISEVNKKFDNKYAIPERFKLINEFNINGFMIYQIYQKK